jgi:hypothetical protein
MRCHYLQFDLFRLTSATDAQRHWHSDDESYTRDSPPGAHLSKRNQRPGAEDKYQRQY